MGEQCSALQGNLHCPQLPSPHPYHPLLPSHPPPLPPTPLPYPGLYLPSTYTPCPPVPHCAPCMVLSVVLLYY